MGKVGAHVSAAGSLSLSLQRAQEIGAECTQIFISPPRQWSKPDQTTEEITTYLQAVESSKITPNFVHGTYLVNLATADPEHLQKSIDWLIYAMQMADKLAIQGVIFHTGSHKGLGLDHSIKQITLALAKILNATKKSQLILENSAGMGGSIGSKFSELGQILKGVNNSRLKICLDTCHAFASGYNLKTHEGLNQTLAEFDREIGIENLVAIHANDSKFDLGGSKDRHANIGDGFIGKDGFKLMLNNPQLTDIPFILEVPGILGKGPDKENIDILKSLRD